MNTTLSRDFTTVGNKAQANAAARHIIALQSRGECPKIVAEEWQRVGAPVVRHLRSLDLN